MMSKSDAMTWLQQCTKDYCAGNVGMSEVVGDFNDIGKLDYVFTSVDELEDIDLGDGSVRRPTYIIAELQGDQKTSICELLKEFLDCFT
jgi:hypothetical protein